MSLWQDIHYSIRSLRQKPALVMTCCIVLALGIGANTTIFSVVKAVLLDPLPYRAPHQLVALFEAGVVKGDVHDEPAPANFYDWQQQSKTLQDVSAYGDTNGNLSGGHDQLPEHINGAFCSWNLFRTLGVAARQGRVFVPADDTTKATRTIILSDSLWKHRFAGDPAIIGQTVRLDAQLYSVIGVMSPGFEFPAATTQFWIPMQLTLPREELTTREDHRLSVVARLRSGTTISQSMSELSGIQAQIARTYPGQTGRSVEVYGLESEVVGQTVRKSLSVLWVAVGCLLLIACVNVANLLLARGTARRREVAVRLALGSSKASIIRLFLLESLILSLAGAGLGALLSWWLVRFLATLGNALPRASTIQLNWPTLLFAVGIALLTGILCGSLPAAFASSVDVNPVIHETGRATFGSVRRRWYRSLLVAAEIALSFLLLIGAGLLLKSFVRLQRVDLGFNAAHLLTMRITLPSAQYPTDTKAGMFFEELLARARAVPGVQSAGLVSWLPAAGQFMNTGLQIAGRPKPPRDETNLVIPRTADPGYFHAMQIPVLDGRIFSAGERLGKADKAMVSSSLVRKYFPNEDPIGKDVSFWNKHWQIIGIVGDVRKNLDEFPEPTIYIPASGGALNFASLAIRTIGDPLQIALPIQREVAHLDPNLAVSDVLTMDQLISKRTANQQFSLILLVSFAGLAVVLASVGLYSVVSYTTAQRTSEFGVRLALGAQSQDLVQLVLQQGLTPALFGMAIGMAAAIGAAQVMQSMLFEVRPMDLSVFASVGSGLLAVAFFANLIPALCAADVDPAQALRSE